LNWAHKVAGVLLFVWAIVLFILLVIPPTEHITEINEKDSFRWDYLEHFGAFGLLTVLFVLWRSGISGNRKRREVRLYLITALTYAASTELIQLFIESRTYNPVDLLLNIAGVIAGIVAIPLFAKTKLGRQGS